MIVAGSKKLEAVVCRLPFVSGKVWKCKFWIKGAVIILPLLLLYDRLLFYKSVFTEKILTRYQHLYNLQKK
jgi:hypothetical protein